MENPAAYQPYRAVVGIPGISNISTTVHNPSFDLNTALSPELSGNETVEYVLSNIEAGDRLLFRQNVDLMYVGFRTGKGYWSIGTQLKATMNFEYPIDILELAWYGSESEEVGGQLSMTNNKTDLTAYLNYHIGYQHEFLGGKLRIGGRFKYLSGLANASASKTDLDATLEADVWNFTTDIQAHTAGAVDLMDPDLSNFDPMAFLFSDNKGYAFDIGASYEVLPGLEISASATDIGSITWTTNTRTYTSQGQYEWDGVDYTYPDKDGEGIDGEAMVEEIIDALEFTETLDEQYTTTLPMNITVGARYDITRKHGFAGTFQMNQWGERMYQNYGISYIGNWSKWFSFYTSYSFVEGDDTNIGVGFSANLGPIQLYLMTDDVYIATAENLNQANIRFGMNVAVYRKDLRGYEKNENDVTPPSPGDAAQPAGNATPAEEASQN